MSRKISIGAALALALLLVAVSIPLTMLYAQKAQNKLIANLPKRMQEFQAMEEIRKVVNEEYYDRASADIVTMEMARGYITGLGDAQSRYLNAEEYQNYTQRLLGQQRDLGVELVYAPNPDNENDPTLDQLNGIVISYVKSGSPAAASGLQAGDHITKVITAEGTEVYSQNKLTGDNYKQWIDKLSDISSISSNTSSISLEISYKRDGDIKTPVSVMIGDSVESISSSLLEAWHEADTNGEKSVGYIKIFYFHKNTAEQLNREIKELSHNGATSYILDLRGCADGTLQYACQALDLLVPVTGGNESMATIHYNGEKTETFPSDATNYFSYAPGGIAVLINSATAGPAELFAYDLQAYHPTSVILVGQPTKGIRTVQQAFPLAHVGGAALLSVGVVTPYGGNESWNANGVQPGIWDDHQGKFTNVYHGVKLNAAGESMQQQIALRALAVLAETKLQG
jgi:carboxyl-terminal processing protease